MSDDDKKSGDYEVGKYRTPTHTRWKKGQSGNPAGRKPASLSLKSAIKNELTEKIVVSDGSGRREVSKMEALAKRLVADALAGDPRKLTELLRQINIHLNEPASNDASLPASEEDAALLIEYVRRATGQALPDQKGISDEPSPDEF